MKRIVCIMMAITMAFSLVACADKESGVTVSKSFATETTAVYSDGDMYDAEDATIVKLSGNTAVIDGNGAELSDNDLFINAGGTYVLSGDFLGTVYIEAKNEIVKLVLENVSIKASNGAAIHEKKAEKLIIVLPENTSNYMEDAAENSDTSGDKIKGTIFAKDDLLVMGEGSLNIKANNNDGINSSDTITLSGMNLTISAKDDGVHADEVLNVLGGSIDILESNEGLEAVQITIEDGEIKVNALDDGINAKGGTENFGMGFGKVDNANSKSEESDESETPCLTINGGNIYVDACGDGLDSNGDIVMNGGYVYVSGSTDSGNNATDYQNTFTMNGGTIIASGASGMYQSVSEGSKCYAIDYMANNTIGAGTECSLYDGDKLLYSFVNKKNANAILISGEELEIDKEYTLVIGKETVKVVASTGVSNGFGMFGGHGGRDFEGRGGRFDGEGNRGQFAPGDDNRREFPDNFIPDDFGAGMPGMPEMPEMPDMPENNKNT